MAGSSLVHDSSGVYIPEMDLTVVLVGPTGQGKSATGNTILEREAFISKACSSRVTQACELQTSVLDDSRTINVIDTPGFVNTKTELLREEVKKCFHLARNRIHAFLYVVSIEQRTSTDAIRKLQRIFGENIINYMIPVYTQPRPHITYIDLLSTRPETIKLCQGRVVDFDNKTKNEELKSKQVQDLLSLVKTVMSKNGGKPFMSQKVELQIQAELKARDATTSEQPVEEQATTMNAIKEQTTQIIDEVEARLRDTTTSLEQKIEAATQKADERAEKYFKEATSELIQQIRKSYDEQMTQRLEAVESRVKDVTTRLKDVTTRLEQQMEAATLKADERDEKYLKEETSELIQRISKSYEEQMTQRLEAVEQRVLDTATRHEQQLAETHAAQMKVNKIARQQMKQRINEEVESRMKDVTTRLEHLAEAEAARLKADERAQEAQKNSEEQIQKPYWRFGVKPFIVMFMLILLLLWDQYRQTHSNVK